MKLKTYAQKITDIMKTQGLIMQDDETTYLEYLNITGGEEYA